MRTSHVARLVVVVAVLSVIFSSPSRGDSVPGQYSLRADLGDAAILGFSGDVAVGADGAIWRAEDEQGTTWRSVPSGVAEDLEAVGTGGEATWAVGGGGILLRSADAGQTWCRVALPTTRRLHDVWVASGDWDGLVMVGEAGTILRSRPGVRVACDSSPSSFEFVPSPVSTDLFAIEGGLIAGAGGTVLRAVGDGYQRMPTPTSAALRGLATWCLRTCGPVVAVGDGGVAISLAPGGESWLAERTFTSRDLYDFGGLFAVGSGGAILIRGNSGWDRVTADDPLCRDLFAVDNLLAGGADGVLLARSFGNTPNHVHCQPQVDSGYRLVGQDGGVFAFGDHPFSGSTGGSRLNSPIVAAADDEGGTSGYWLAAGDGGVFAFGGATFWGSLGDRPPASPVVDIAARFDGSGYWLVTAKGEVSAFGSSTHVGDLSRVALAAPVVAMTATSSGMGYWLLGRDGGVFAFGDARFHGSTGDRRPNAPMVDISRSPCGDGYYLMGSDGGVFTFGAAPFLGSTGSRQVNAPVIAIRVTHDRSNCRGGQGYWLVGSDGGVFTFGAARFHGSLGAVRLNSPIVDVIG